MHDKAYDYMYQIVQYFGGFEGWISVKEEEC